MKKVVVFRSNLLPISETFVREQALALKQWQPILLGLRKLDKGLPLEPLTCVLVPHLWDNLIQRWLTKYCLWFYKPIPQLVSVLKDIKPDLVHVHFGTDAVDIWPSIKAAGLPMLITLHGYDINIHKEWWQAGHGGWRCKYYPQQLLSIAAEPNVRFIAVSEAIKQRAIAYGIDAKKIDVSYIGVDIKRFSPAGLPIVQRKKRILFVGRMVEKKAPLLLIQAFAQVIQSIPDAELVMVGDGPLKQQAEFLAKELGVTVHFTGALSSDEVLAHIHEARLFCLPSITAENGDAEGFGMVILEAQACGVPVITSAMGGAQEGIKTGETGYFFACGSLDELVNQLHQVLTLDDDRLSRMSEEARRFVQTNFNVSALVAHLEQHYQQLISYPS